MDIFASLCWEINSEFSHSDKLKHEAKASYYKNRNKRK